MLLRPKSNDYQQKCFYFYFRSSIPSIPTSPEEASGQDSVDCVVTPIVRLDESQLDHEPEVVMVIPLFESRCEEPPGNYICFRSHLIFFRICQHWLLFSVIIVLYISHLIYYKLLCERSW